ncbi:hypothetical protein APLC1_0185 [Limnospira platensis C1]|nr:hypothetical protein APLC1_0185 [Arthrospira platensis C1]
METELQHRSELNYPPSGGLILLRLRGYDAIEVEQTAHRIASELSSELLPGTCELLGPAPAPIMRVANQYRWQILLKFLPGQTTPTPSLAALAKKCPPLFASPLMLTLSVSVNYCHLSPTAIVFSQLSSHLVSWMTNFWVRSVMVNPKIWVY